MKIPKFWQKKAAKERPFRRIYKGSVPILSDNGDMSMPDMHITGQPRGSRVSTHSQTAGGSMDAMEPKPTAVRRSSFATNSLPPRKPELIPEKFPDNLVVSTRYTIWTFLPKNLFEQFRRVVNFYFLMVALIQTISDSPVHPATSVSPLAFVILVTAVKQGYEDWLRHKNDEQVNSRPVTIIKDGELKTIKSRDVQVGDVVQLEADEQVPTDLLLLGSSDEFLRCQINTANLDGETNLKLRYCPSGLPHFKTIEDFDHLHIIVECEQPNEDLYEFNGSLLIPADKLKEMNGLLSVSSEGPVEAASKDVFPDMKSGLVRQDMTDFLSIPLSMDNMVLRGTRLKNTDYIYGIVIYTGRDTRLARNSEKSESKFSTVESAVNYYLMFFIGALLLMVIFCTTMHYAVTWYPKGDADGDPWYVADKQDENKTVKKVFNTLASFIVLYNYIIPISLYVTIELQKFLGSKFFVWDQDLMDDDGKEPLCNTSDLNEELGQIEYLFSDKTGTLTQNVMKVRNCSIEAVRFEYRSDENLYKLGPAEEASAAPVDVSKNPTTLRFFRTLALCHSVQVVPKRRPSFDFGNDQAMPDFKLLTKEKNAKRKSRASNRRMSLRTPEPSTSDSVDGIGINEASMEFQASSPDEKALLETCQKLGIHYLGEKEDVMTLEIMGVLEKHKRLMHLEFDADRKCMSVIAENSAGEIWLLTKGAESSIIPKCDTGPTHETLKHVMDYALMGLRTLAVAVRRLTNKQYEEFSSELWAARRLLKNRQQKVREVYSSIESHMTLIGATGVEDQLQDYVPETLQSFAVAGIRVWMLTGDKLETGVNVAVSCGLITASTKQYIVSRSSDGGEIRERLLQIQNEMEDSDNTCFVIDGDSLATSFKVCPEVLREVSMKAYRVVCCRMAPLQKAQVVQMVKNSKGKPTCCAVGDGANDCAMILAAHVGIGILGKEGRQAARCADFALAKFGYLRKAILVHGHFYYVRLANLANYFFYKNVVFVLPQFFFAFHSNFSTLALFNGLFLMNYNIFFSSCPIFFYGLTEQPYSADVLMRDPLLYKKNRKNNLMTFKKFLPWLISAMWHSVVAYFLPYLSWGNFDEMNDVVTYGTIVFICVVVMSNNKMAVETKFISWWYVGAQIYSYATFMLITGVYSEVDLRRIGLNSGDFHHVLIAIFGSICFWLLLLLAAVVAIVPDLLFAAIRHSWEHVTRHFQAFGKGGKLLKLRKKSIPIPKATLLFSKRSGSLVISNSTLASYLPNNEA